MDQFKKASNDDDDDDDEAPGDHDKMMDAVKGEEKFDAELSLAADGDSKIEPFNLNDERYGGGGYFDATGNYVFRSGNVNPDETDAWLDGLGEGKDQAKVIYDKKEELDDDDDNDEEITTNMTDSVKASLFGVMANLLHDQETVLKALRRLGKLKNPDAGKKKSSGGYGKKKEKAQQQAKTPATAENTAAAVAFNQLTDAADALLNAGETDIYEITKQALLVKVQECGGGGPGSNYFGGAAGAEPNAEGDADATQWEYRGQDGNIHGPYPSKSMFEWVSKGYFTGANAVDVRIWNGAVNGGGKETEAKEDLADDLMDDLADDLMDEGEDAAPTKPSDDSKTEEKWQRSDKVNFAGYC